MPAGLQVETDNRIEVAPPERPWAAGPAEDATPVAGAVAAEWLQTGHRCPDGVIQTYSAHLPPWVAPRAPAGMASQARGTIAPGCAIQSGGCAKWREAPAPWL